MRGSGVPRRRRNGIALGMLRLGCGAGCGRRSPAFMRRVACVASLGLALFLDAFRKLSLLWRFRQRGTRVVNHWMFWMPVRHIASGARRGSDRMTHPKMGRYLHRYSAFSVQLQLFIPETVILPPFGWFLQNFAGFGY